MAFHYLFAFVDDPAIPGKIDKTYTRINVTMPAGAGGWCWTQIDAQGKSVPGSSQSSPFATEQDAVDDAVNALSMYGEEE